MSFAHLALMIAEHASTRALDALTTLVLIRLLDADSLGAFMVDQSRVALILLFFPALETILYREYGRHRADGTLGREIAVFRRFNALKLAAAVALTAVFAAVPLGGLDARRRLAMFALAFALPLAQALYGIHREVLRFELRQGVVVLINAVQRVALIAAVLLASQLTGGSATWIAAGALAVFVVFGGVWAGASHLLLGSVARAGISFRAAAARIRSALGEAVLWLHLAGAVMAAVQTLDVFFLSRTNAPLDEIAAYSVALKAANFFQLIPLPFAQFFGVYLGRKAAEGDARAEQRLVWLGFAVLSVLGVIMCALGAVAAAPILSFLSKGKFAPDQVARAVEYFHPMLIGVAVQGAGFAFSTYLTSRANVASVVFLVHLPWFLLSAAGYAWASALGPMSVARFNVPVGALYLAGQGLYFIVTRLKKR